MHKAILLQFACCLMLIGCTPAGNTDGQTANLGGSVTNQEPIAIDTPEIIRVLEKEDVDAVATTHSQTIWIRLEDRRQFRGTYVHADAGEYSRDEHLYDILNLVNHIHRRRSANEKLSWSVICE